MNFEQPDSKSPVHTEEQLEFSAFKDIPAQEGDFASRPEMVESTEPKPAETGYYISRDDDPDEVYSSAYRAKMSQEAQLSKGRGRLKIKDYRDRPGNIKPSGGPLSR